MSRNLYIIVQKDDLTAGQDHQLGLPGTSGEGTTNQVLSLLTSCRTQEINGSMFNYLLLLLVERGATVTVLRERYLGLLRAGEQFELGLRFSRKALKEVLHRLDYLQVPGSSELAHEFKILQEVLEADERAADIQAQVLHKALGVIDPRTLVRIKNLGMVSSL